MTRKCSYPTGPFQDCHFPTGVDQKWSILGHRFCSFCGYPEDEPLNPHLRGLLTRLHGENQPNRVADFLIRRAIQGKPILNITTWFTEHDTVIWEDGSTTEEGDCPRYTRSIDIALTLAETPREAHDILYKAIRDLGHDHQLHACFFRGDLQYEIAWRIAALVLKTRKL